MTDTLQKALQRRDELERELELLDQFIDLHVKLFGGAKVAATGHSSAVSSASGVGTTKNEKANDPKAVADGVEAILQGASQPVQRGKLIAMLEGNGLPIQSQDKSKYIGTILWRNRERFINVDGRGYWLKSRPVPSPFPDTRSMFEQDS